MSLSQCCPSRATLLTGRDAHNHGVLSTYGPFGGFQRLDASETLPVWLQRAGYATVLVGKYLNHYGGSDPYEVPLGWSEWHALLSRSSHRVYGYTMNHDGVLRTHADYQTDEITTLAEAVVRRRAAGRTPFFLWLTYGAPHTGVPVDLRDPPQCDGVEARPRLVMWPTPCWTPVRPGPVLGPRAGGGSALGPAVALAWGLTCAGAVARRRPRIFSVT